MSTRKLTQRQKDKLKESEYFRSNSSDLTINKSFQDVLEYDEDGNLVYDKRTREGKEIERIINSKIRSCKKNESSDKTEQKVNNDSLDEKLDVLDRELSEFEDLINEDVFDTTLENESESKKRKSHSRDSDKNVLLETQTLRRTIIKEYIEDGWSIRVYGDGHATAKKGTDLKRADSESEIHKIIQDYEEELSNESESKKRKSHSQDSDKDVLLETQNLRRTIIKEYIEDGWSIRVYGDGHATAKKGAELKRADSESEIHKIIQGYEEDESSDSCKKNGKSAFTGESTGTIIDIDSSHQTYQTPAPWMGVNSFFDEKIGLWYDGAGHYTWKEYYANIYWINNLNGKRQSQEIRDKIKSEIGDARLTDNRLNKFLKLNYGKTVDLICEGGHWELADLDQLDYNFID